MLTNTRPYRGLGMEGVIANWYARNTAKDMAAYRRDARLLANQLQPGGRVLEVASGPGYLAIELAKLGEQRVTGLDISDTFVRISADNARKSGVAVAFRKGNAAEMPFDPASFDGVVCRAAFKNFSDPVGALNEMYRVLVPGGLALIIDLNRDVPQTNLDAYVGQMGLGAFDTWMTRLTFKHILIKRAYTLSAMTEMIAESRFRDGDFRSEGIGLQVWLRKEGLRDIASAKREPASARTGLAPFLLGLEARGASRFWRRNRVADWPPSARAFEPTQ
jgi:ubiquinone/menaquinone biosynthesis C-methylase UbiE